MAAKRIEVHHHEVDRLDARGADRLHVLGKVAAREQAAVDLRMQGLYPAVEHLGEAGVGGHLGHRHALLLQELGGAAGGEQLDAESGERACELDDARLVRDADERPLDLRHYPLMRSCCILVRSVARLMPSIAAACVRLPLAWPSTVSIIGLSMFFSTIS